MALVVYDRVRETCAAPGTASVTLLGAVSGYQSFSVVGNGNTCYYAIADQSGSNWEVGIGTYSTTGPTLARTTVLASSNAGALVNFTTGSQDVFLTYPAGKAVYLDASGQLTSNVFASSGATITGGSINNTPIGATTASTGRFTGVTVTAGTASVPPIQFTSGTNLTTATAGAVEYDGVNAYFTTDTTHGRNVVPEFQQFVLSANGTAFGPTVGNFFGTNSAASLAAATTYDIECFCYMLKTTAGTLTWAPTVSSAAALIHSEFWETPITGFTTTVITGALVQSEATINTATAATHAVSGSLTTAVNHLFKFKIRITTTLACNFRMNVTQSAGTLTPLAGSWYTVRKVASNAGNFVA